jgi:hypothetical protein
MPRCREVTAWLLASVLVACGRDDASPSGAGGAASDRGGASAQGGSGTSGAGQGGSGAGQGGSGTSAGQGGTIPTAGACGAAVEQPSNDPACPATAPATIDCDQEDLACTYVESLQVICPPNLLVSIRCCEGAWQGTVAPTAPPCPGAGGEAGQGGAGAQCSEPIAQPPMAGCGIYGTVLLEYQVDQATADELSFSVRLRAGALGPVPIDQIEVHYYLSQEETSGWQATVDYFVQQAPDVDHTATSQISIEPLTPKLDSFAACQTHFVRIRNDASAELQQPNGDGTPYLEFHVTLTPNDAAAPNQTHDDDDSYAAAATRFQTNLGMGAFACGMLVHGCTPGQTGTCD